MKALLSVSPGGPETLELTELPDPDAGAGQVVVDIKAAGVNFPDTLIIKDLYQFKPPRPFAPGTEFAGTVAAVGAGVERISVGQRVGGIAAPCGAFATKVAVPAQNVFPIGELPFETAAGLVMTYGTSYHALKDRAALKSGETLLVLGAAGGVGSAAVELGKSMGAKVVAAISSEEKAAFCRDLGADETVIYPTGDLDRDAQKGIAAQFKDACGRDGADVIYDAVGGAYAEPALRSIAWEGRYLVVGFPAGIPSIPLNLTLLKGCQVVGVFWGAAVQRDPERHAANLADLNRMLTAGEIKPRITETFDLAEGAKALERLENRQAAGKLVITM